MLDVPTLAWPFAGRSAELSRGRRALTDGSTTGFVLTGAAGVGKTRLARELVAIAARAGAPTRWIAATRSAATIPFGALAELLPDLESGALTRFDLLRIARDRVVAGLGGSRLVLGVDDIHLLDDASAALVHQLALSRACHVVATLREGEELPDAVQALLKEPTTDRLRLDALSRDETDLVVAAALDGEVALATRRALWRLSAGNALVLSELIRSALEDGTLVERDGLWRHRSELGRSRGLATIVAARLQSLDATAREALEVVALAEPLGLGLLESICGQAPVDTLERQGLIAVADSGQRTECRLVHPAYTDAVLVGLTHTHRRRLCRRIADALDATGERRRPDVLRLATLRLDGGGAADPGLLVRGARQAQERFDHVLAGRLARAAAEAGDAEGWRVLGEALVAQRRAAEALDALAEAERQAPDRRQRVLARLARATTVLLHTGESDEAMALLDSAAEEAGDDPDCRAALEAARALALSFLGDFAGCMAVADALLGRESTNRRALVETLTVSTFVQAFNGQAKQALADAERGLELLDALGDPLPFAGEKLDLNAVLALLSLGRLQEAEKRATAGYRAAADAGALDVVGVHGTILALVLLARGRPARAQRLLAESRAALETSDPLDMQRTAAALTALATALLGDVEAAGRWLGVHDGFAAGRPDRFSVLRVRAGAWVAAQRGHADDAVGRAREAADAARAIGHLTWAAFALHDLARFGRPDLAVDELAEIASRADGALFPAFAAHAEALTAGAGRDLAAVSATFERLGMPLLAAEAAVEATRAYRAAGDADAASLAGGRAVLLANACEGARTPALSALGTTLTPREAEIAGLAATGLTSRAIAEALTLSVRTVDNHLRRVYGKLGVTDRRALGHLVGQTDHEPPA